jgi:hypothetical protein
MKVACQRWGRLSEFAPVTLVVASRKRLIAPPAEPTRVEEESKRYVRPRAGTVLLAIVGLVAMNCQRLLEPLPDPPLFEAVVAHVSSELDEATGSRYLSTTVTDLAYVGQPGNVDPATGRAVDFITVNAWQDTRCFTRKGGALAAVSCETLRDGDRIQVWSEFALAIFPPRYSADQIIILLE